MKRIAVSIIALVGLMACEGGTFRKKDCQTCETLTYNGQGQQVNRNEMRVCGDGEVADYIKANTINTSSLSVVTTCNK
jgi:hypothetical protein